MVSPTRLSRIKEQGYKIGFTDEDISAHAPGNRFAYQLCTLLFTTGLLLRSIPVLTVAAIIAFLTVVLPNHPFDYLYNSVIRHWFKRPMLPKRSSQAKFACGLASVWLGIIIYLFYHSLFIWGYILGGMLIVIALLVSTIDFCIPSLFYNKLFGGKSK
jgi:hypothetical protein